MALCDVTRGAPTSNRLARSVFFCASKQGGQPDKATETFWKLKLFWRAAANRGLNVCFFSFFWKYQGLWTVASGHPTTLLLSRGNFCRRPSLGVRDASIYRTIIYQFKRRIHFHGPCVIYERGAGLHVSISVRVTCAGR